MAGNPIQLDTAWISYATTRRSSGKYSSQSWIITASNDIPYQKSLAGEGRRAGQAWESLSQGAVGTFITQAYTSVFALETNSPFTAIPYCVTGTNSFFHILRTGFSTSGSPNRGVALHEQHATPQRPPGGATMPPDSKTLFNRMRNAHGVFNHPRYPSTHF